MLPRRTLHYVIFSSPKSMKKIEFHFKMCPESNSAPSLCPGKSQTTLKTVSKSVCAQKKVGAIITIQISLRKIFYTKYADIKMFRAVSPEMLNPGTPKFSAMMHRYYRSFAE